MGCWRPVKDYKERLDFFTGEMAPWLPSLCSVCVTHIKDHSMAILLWLGVRRILFFPSVLLPDVFCTLNRSKLRKRYFGLD